MNLITLKTNRILQNFVKKIGEGMGVNRCSLIIVDEEWRYGEVIACHKDESVEVSLDLKKYPEIKKVLITGKPLFLRNFNGHPLMTPVKGFITPFKGQSVYLFPIIVRKEVKGVLFLRVSGERGELSDKEISICQLVTTSISGIIENNKLLAMFKDETQKKELIHKELEETQKNLIKRNVEILSLFDASKALLSANDRDRLVRHVLEHSQRLIPSEASVLFLLEDGEAKLKGIFGDERLIEAIFDIPIKDFVSSQIPIPFPSEYLNLQPLKDGLLSSLLFKEEFISHSRSWFVNSSQSFPPYLKNLLFVPLVARSSGKGVILFVNKEEGFDDEDSRLMDIFSSEVVIALENLETKEEVRRKERELSLIVEGLEDGIMLLDRGLRIIYANRSLGRLFHLNPSELFNRACRDTDFRGTELCKYCDAGEIFETAQARHKYVELPLDGRRLFLSVGFYPIIDDAGTVTHVMVCFRDLTHQRSLEEEIVNSRRLASLGEMSAQFAHEIKNPLQRIETAVEYLRAYTSIADSEKEVFDTIIRGVKEIDGIVKDSLEYARPLTLEYKETSLTGLVNSVIEEFSDVLREKAIIVDREYDDEIDMVIIDGFRMKGVLQNIIENSIHSMPDGGRLNIKTRLVERDLKRKERELMPPGALNALYNKIGRVEISVKDTGCGIDKEDIQRVFDPFFTTKNRGIGLGMAFVKKVVDLHRGDVSIKSKKGKGTELIIRLPVYYK